MGAPGPDDPRYWERLKKGPPLDEWVDINSPRFKAEMAEKFRREERRLRVVSWAIGLVVAAFFAWQIVSSSGATPPDCTSVPETPCLNAAGRVLIPGGADGALTTLSLEEWREAKAEAEAPNGICQDDRGAYPC